MRQADFGAQLGMWFQYFGWQFAHDLKDQFAAAIAVVFGLFGVLGAIRHWQANKRHAIAMTLLIFTFTVLLIFYLNFKYGYSQYLSRGDIQREVRERDYFFICSFALWGIWVGMGLATLMEWITEALATRVPDVTRRWMYATPILLVALVPLWGNHLTASRHGERLARDFAYDLLQSVEPYGILVTAGDNDTFPLWYAQEVDGVRPDVTVIVTSLGNINWYLAEAENRPLPTYDPAAGPAIFRNRTWPKPGPWFAQYYKTATDTLPEILGVDQPVTGNLGALKVTLDPRQLPQPGYLVRVDLAVFQMIKEDLGRRPIYFSTTTADYGDKLGLSPYLVTEGMVRHLMTTAVVPNDSIKLSPVQGRYINEPLTVTLGFDVYHGASAARTRPRGWVDGASQNILVPYIITYDTIAEALAKSDPVRARQAYAIAMGTLGNTTYQFQLAPPTP
jgi:hypothetical protein